MRRYNEEEYVPTGASLALQQRMADRNQELTDQRQMRAEEAQREARATSLQGIRGLAEDVSGGFKGFMDEKNKRDRQSEEDRRFNLANAREDKREGREAEEFGLRKPELEARSRTAEERVQGELDLNKANVKQANAGARSSEVAANIAEAKQAWNSAPSKESPSETNFEYMNRMEREGKTAELKLKKAELDSFIAEAPGRRQFQQAQINQANAGTKAQQIANAKAEQDAETANLIALANAPTNMPTEEQARRLGPKLTAMYQEGKLTPAQAGRIISGIKSTELQAQIQQNLLKTSSPEFQAKFQQLEKTKETLRQSADGLIQMAKAVQENEKGLFSDDAAITNFTNALRSMGREADAISVESRFPDPSDAEKGLFTRQQRMKAKLNSIAAELRAKNIDPELRSDPIVQNYLGVLDNLGRGNLGGQPVNLFGAPQQTMPAQNQQPGQFNFGGQQLNFQGQGQMATPARPSPSGKPRNSTAATFGGKN